MHIEDYRIEVTVFYLYVIQAQMSTPSKRGNQAISIKKSTISLLKKKQNFWSVVPSWAQHIPPAPRSILTPPISKVMVPEDAELPSRSGILILKGEVYRYRNTVGDALLQEMYFIIH